MASTFRGRRAVHLENGLVRVSVLVGGGHIAEISLVEKAVNPLWIPPWTSIEPCDFDPALLNTGCQSYLWLFRKRQLLDA